MVYMFKIYTLVAVSVFSLAGAFILAFIVWNVAVDYARARHPIRRIASVAFRERLAISRPISRNHSTDSMRVV